MENCRIIDDSVVLQVHSWFSVLVKHKWARIQRYPYSDTHSRNQVLRPLPKYKAKIEQKRPKSKSSFNIYLKSVMSGIMYFVDVVLNVHTVPTPGVTV